MSPGFHVVDDAKVVLVPANAALDLMEEIPQLHEDNQACHGQPYVAKKLKEKKEEQTIKVEDWVKGELNITYTSTCSLCASYQHMNMVHKVQKQHG